MKKIIYTLFEIVRCIPRTQLIDASIAIFSTHCVNTPCGRKPNHLTDSSYVIVRYESTVRIKSNSDMKGSCYDDCAPEARVYGIYTRVNPINSPSTRDCTLKITWSLMYVINIMQKTVVCVCNNSTTTGNDRNFFWTPTRSHIWCKWFP